VGSSVAGHLDLLGSTVTFLSSLTRGCTRVDAVDSLWVCDARRISGRWRPVRTGAMCCTCSYDHCYRRGRRKREKSDETAAVTQPDAILLVGRVIKYPTRLVGAARLDLPRRPTCTHERDRPAAGWALVRHGSRRRKWQIGGRLPTGSAT
jgi:hypothetical protein